MRATAESLCGLNFGVLEALITAHKKSNRSFTDECRHRLPSFNQAWREFVFCILAGTQVRAEKAALATAWLFRSLPQTSDPYRLQEVPDLQRSTAQALTDIGYRFPAGKAKTICSALDFVCERGDAIIVYFSRGRLVELRSDVVANVWGVGLKIASHWIRNCSAGVPVIDVHVRRALVALSFLPAGFARSTIDSEGYELAERSLCELAHLLQVDASWLDYVIWAHVRAGVLVVPHQDAERGCSLCHQSAWQWNPS